MARAIKIEDMGRYVCQQQMEKLLRAAVLETDSLLKQASPVDTGRFRASWQVGEDSATGGIAPPGDYGAAPPLTRIGYGQEKVGNVYSVHNNLPYAEPLANGSSKQASPGWVQGIAKDVQSRVRKAADDIGRNS
jgi:hypothetical protein